MRRYTWYLLLAGVANQAAGIAFAQTAQSPAAAQPGPIGQNVDGPSNPADVTPASARSAANDSGLQDIVVTAQRRAQNLLSVPLSISATTGEALQKTGLKDISSLTYNTPGLIAESGVGYTQLYIRGIGNGIFVGADPSIATFVDDVPRIYGSLINTFINVERVEVLKGAQGGLYGRNATGGVVNIITRQPSDKLSAEGRISYGERNTFEAAAYANIPITDRIAWNFSIDRQKHDPYVKNLAVKNPLTAANFPGDPDSAADAATINEGSDPPKGTNNRNFWAADTKLRIQPTDNLKITLGGDYARKHDSDGNGWFNETPMQTAALLHDTYYFGAAHGQPVFPGGLPVPPKKFTNYADTPSAAYITDYGVNGKLVLSLPEVDLTAISSYRRNKTFYEADTGAAAVPILVPVVVNHKWNFYQELRAVSTNTGRFHFLGGASYLHNHVLGAVQVFYINNPAFAAPKTQSTDDVYGWSVYGQAAYDFTDRLTLTASLRYVHELNKAHFTLPSDSRTSLVGKKPLPSVTLSYKINDGTIYARYAKGFKTGGVNPGVPPSDFPNGVGSTFGPEKVDTYEVGLRTALFDRKVQLTTAVFYNSYKGLQTITNGDGSHLYITEAIINAGSARSYGAEGSINWRVVRPVTLGVNVGYLNARYKKFALGANSAGLAAFDFSGQKMIFSPTWQTGVTTSLDQPINDRLNLTGNLLWSYVGRTKFFNSAAAGIPSPEQAGYSLVNLRLGVRTADNRYEVALYANNIFNEGYTTFAGSSAIGNSPTWGNPRIIGGEITVKY